MPRRILVTRPEPGASQTARRLEALGYRPVLLPLFETRALVVDRAAIPKTPGVVAATSANAIRYAPPQLIEALAQLPCFAVGEKTAAAARSAGFEHVVEGPGDAESLARTIIATGVVGPVVYLCGHVRRPVFEDLLAAAGIVSDVIETYTTCQISHAADFLFGDKKIHVALIYSVKAAEALLDIADRAGFRDRLENIEFFCLSARVAKTLELGVRGKIRIAAEPTEDALLSLLKKPV